MTVKLQGTIVSPDYDDEYFAAWIDRGIITPSSRVVSAVESATEPFDLYINSFGGDVFAGGEMQIALIKAAIAGNIRKCEVGSIAASMAANIVAALRANGVPVAAHVNSQLMFHGCYTYTEGGAQHHEDVAESLRNINEAVMASLKRCGVEECRAWFSEGREKWIDADEGRALNLFTSIAETDADAPVEAKHTAARLAAFASTIQSRTEYQMKLDETIKAEEPVEAAPVAPVEPVPEAAPAVEETPAENAPKTPVEAPAPETSDDTPAEAEAPVAAPVAAENEAPKAEVTIVTDEAFEARVAEAANKRFAGLQAKHDKKISDLTIERDAALKDLESAKAEATSLKGEIEKLTADLAAVRDQLAKSEQNRESVVTAALAPAPRFEGDARAHLATLPPSQRAAFYKAHKAEIDRN